MRVSVAQGRFATEQSLEETEVEVQDTADTPVEETTETEAE